MSDAGKATDGEARRKAEAADLRHRYSTGHYTDNLPRIVPGIVNTRAMGEAAFLERLESLGQIQEADRPRLREARLESLKDEIQLLGARLDETYERASRLEDSFGEIAAHALSASGRISAHLVQDKEDRRNLESELLFLHSIIMEAVGDEAYEAAVERTREEVARTRAKETENGN